AGDCRGGDGVRGVLAARNQDQRAGIWTRREMPGADDGPEFVAAAGGHRIGRCLRRARGGHLLRHARIHSPEIVTKYGVTMKWSRLLLFTGVLFASALSAA